MGKRYVTREDGTRVNVVAQRGQLIVCETGCCCGQTERDFAPVPHDLYHSEWERRRLRNKVHLTFSACLGPCVLANVALLLFDGQSIWFHSLNRNELVLALYDYIEEMLKAARYLSPPEPLAGHVFAGFVPTGEHEPARARRAAGRGGSALA
ncbi:MAG TPA: (2Fe-2S) ferredoxin domain-containing protein [Ktedonobacteraceae bacterium]